ncbi:hypothetical protein [Embleya hyalina]|uniref:Core-binding (CB) domain-containing protein n=1 Tax=Embleya hyalina TaxID=516124 RepID=A0A401YYF0_9ACTN|nr:hypothetical protein [Embleya hyalina]GCD99621.1 hypothetical protein EHYA_07343 [Embleya hyalina]
MCHRCYPRSPHTVLARAATLTQRLPHVPSWWDDYAAHLTTHRNPMFAADLVARTARLLLATPGAESTDPHTVLARAHTHAPEIRPALADFFHAHHLIDPPADPTHTRATARRAKRIHAVPIPLRQAVEEFADALMSRRDHAPTLGLQPVKLRTVEVRLDTVRDLAQHLHAQGHTTWASATTADLEAFLARNPARRAAWLAGMRQFFGHAHRTGHTLHDPTAPLTASQNRGFKGPSLTLDDQRTLYRRWVLNPDDDVHPHEAFIGLAALLHAATITELRLITDDGIDTTSRTLHLPARPVATPLDDATWTALHNCLRHRTRLGSTNPHPLITRRTRTTRTPPGAAHIREALAPVGLLPQILRSTRLLTLVQHLDIEMLTAALGMSYSGVTPYLNPQPTYRPRPVPRSAHPSSRP